MIHTPKELLRNFRSPNLFIHNTEYDLLGTLGKALNPREGLEFGTEGGFSTEMLMDSCPELHLTTVDINPCESAREKLKNRNVDFIQTNTADLAWNRMVDFLFIDASHTYDDVYRELETFSRWVNNLILLHDTQSFIEVNRAIEDFVMTHNRIWVYLPYDERFGMGLVWRIDG